MRYMNGFCERKFRSKLLSGIFTKAVMYIMLLCDSIIAGYFVGEPGVAAINAITPVTGVVTFFGDLCSTGVKDPVWKYKWVEKNEPELFAKVDKWLDVGDYLVSRCIGKIIRTADSAFATFLYDTRKGREGWNKGLLKMYKVKPEHLPPIINSTDLAGGYASGGALCGKGASHHRQGAKGERLAGS